MSRRSPSLTVYPPSFPAEDASAWRRIRRYAVPRWMIEQATERREAGDWRGACAAANVDVGFDLAYVAREYGTDTAAVLEEDLRHLAPDLLRWHLPRRLHGRTTLRPDQHILLAEYANASMTRSFLYAVTRKLVDGPQRFTLRFGETRNLQPVRTHDWRTSRYLWDTRYTDEFRYRAGEGEQADRLIALHDQGETAQAFRAAGIDLDETLPEIPGRYDPKYVRNPPLLDALAALPIAVTRLVPEMKLLSEAGFGHRFQMLLNIPKAVLTRVVFELRPNTGRASARLAVYGEVSAVPVLPEVCWQRLPDLSLLRLGEIMPAQLHPLVRDSLSPGHSAAEKKGQTERFAVPAIRVRCRAEWHEVRSADGELQIPHTNAEQRREQAMRAFGGPVAGCFAVQQAWTSGTGRLPKALREQRRELFSYVQHGDTPAVVQLLDAGIDPRVRNGRQQTLLHLLHQLDHEVLLPRLLRAGLDLEARDQGQCTPLFLNVWNGGQVSLVRALLDAGARTDVADHRGIALPDLIIWAGRANELRFLKDAVERDYPDLAATLDEEAWAE